MRELCCPNGRSSPAEEEPRTGKLSWSTQPMEGSYSPQLRNDGLPADVEANGGAQWRLVRTRAAGSRTPIQG